MVAAEESPSLPADYKVPAVWTMKDVGGKWAKTNRPTAGPQSEKELPKGEHALQLYSMATPNGVKVTILLEELVELFPDFEYDAWLTQILDGSQFTSGFVKVNPNSKVPAMMDYSDPAKPVRIFESGSILLYLCEKYDKDGVFLPKDPAVKAECISWLMWQMGSGANIAGGFGHFYTYAPTKIEYAIDRFSMETKRLIDVLDKHLADGRQFVCGEQYTIADIAIYPWVGGVLMGTVFDAAEFLQADSYVHAMAWAKRIAERPAVIRGRKVNRPFGEKSDQLHERHARADFDTKTEDKIEEAEQ